MALGKHGSSEIAVFLVGGYDLLANKVQGVSRKVKEINQRTDGCGDSWETSAHTGMSSGAFTQSGAFFDDTTNQLHTAMKTPSAARTSRVGIVVWAGNAVGASCVGFAGLLGVEYEVLGALSGLTKANAAYGVNGQVEDGVLLAAWGAVTANTNGTGVDNSAASTNGGAAYLEVSAFSGFTGVAVKIQDSADNSSWADVTGGAFTSITAAQTAQRIAITGTIRRYTRYVATVTGSGSITLAVALARG
jgi:hypothetical protein